MKLTKQIKSKLAVMLDKALNWYFLNNPDNEKFIAKIIDKIEIILNDNPRNLAHQKVYWVFCEWLSGNIPEWLHNILGIENFTSETIHSLLKAKMDISSTAFSAMDETEFQVYHNAVKSWVATYLLKCKVEDINEMVKSS